MLLASVFGLRFVLAVKMGKTCTLLGKSIFGSLIGIFKIMWIILFNIMYDIFIVAILLDISKACLFRASVMICFSSSWVRALGLILLDAEATMLLIYLCRVSISVLCRCFAVSNVSFSMVKSEIT